MNNQETGDAGKSSYSRVFERSIGAPGDSTDPMMDYAVRGLWSSTLISVWLCVCPAVVKRVKKREKVIVFMNDLLYLYTFLFI